MGSTHPRGGAREAARRVRFGVDMRRSGAPPALAGLFLLSALVAPAPGAEPCLLGIDPDAGPAAGGTRIDLRLADGVESDRLEVRFGERPGRILDRRGNVLEVEAPPHAPGSIPVRVAAEACQVAGDGVRFTYLAPPRLLSVRPLDLHEEAGDLVLEVTGSGFAVGATLLVDGIPVPTDRKDGERWEARVPASLLGTARHMVLQVSAPQSGVSDSLILTLANPVPELIGLEAPLFRAGRRHAPLRLHGHGFRPVSVIQLGGKPLETRFHSDQDLEAVLPAEALAQPGSLSVRVETPGPGGGRSNPLELTVLPPPPFGGRFVVFMSNRYGGRNRILLLDRQTGTLDPLREANSVNAGDGYPSISADGRFIVFQSDRHRGQSDILLFDRESRTLDLLPEANHPEAFDGFPSVSPDGRFIVFESDRLHHRPKIFLFDRDTRLLTELSQANEGAADDGVAAISN